MIGDVKRNKNIVIMYRKYKTGTHCLSCSRCAWPEGIVQETLNGATAMEFTALFKAYIE